MRRVALAFVLTLLAGNVHPQTNNGSPRFVIDEAPRPSESDPAAMEALKRRVSVLLRGAFDDARPQSVVETWELIHLLHLREVRASIDTTDALAAVTRRQITRSF